MNGRKWHWITLGGHVAAQTGLARPIGFALFPTYAEDEWFRHRNQRSIGAPDFCGFPGVCARWVFCIASIWSWQGGLSAAVATYVVPISALILYHRSCAESAEAGHRIP